MTEAPVGTRGGSPWFATYETEPQNSAQPPSLIEGTGRMSYGPEGGIRMHRRATLDQLPLDEGYLHSLMRRLFCKGSDFGLFEERELVHEFAHFGVPSRKQARLLLKKHRRAVIAMDRSPIEVTQLRVFEHAFGEDCMRRFRRTRIWFTYPGLIRLALELEFGEQYTRFADQRDAVGEGQSGSPADASVL